jgi:hypothetical protein
MDASTKPILNVYFHGFWDTNEIIYTHYFKNSHSFLFGKYDVRAVTDPMNADVILCSVFGQSPLPNVPAPKILLIHENIRPQNAWFDAFDYVISFTHGMDYQKKHFRIPYWIYRFYEYGVPLKVLQNERKSISLQENYLDRRFANFVYSNPVPFRLNFARELSQTYRQVDFAGKVDTTVSDEERAEIAPSKLGKAGLAQKATWLNKYRFTIAFENSSQEGYTTEKIFDAYMGNTVPIYWGNLRMKAEGFNPETFLNYFDTPGNERFINRIKEVDMNGNAYMEMLNKPMFVNPPKYLEEGYMLNFYENMIGRKL